MSYLAARSGCARLGLERLEGRLLLSAAALQNGVLVRVVAGDLMIRGNKLDNAVSITQDGDVLVVRGLPTEHGPTLVNGSEQAVRFPRARDDVRISLAGGNDSVVIEPVQQADQQAAAVALPGDLQIAMGNGDDEVVLRETTIAGRAQIHLGFGAESDQTQVVDCVIARDLGLYAGGGNDTGLVENNQIGRRVVVQTGAGDDILNCVDNVFKRLELNGGSGVDYLDGGDDPAVVGKLFEQFRTGGASIPVPANLPSGATYHLVFVTHGTYRASSTSIGTYDGWAQGEANAAGIGSTAGITWKVIGSTATVNAKNRLPAPSAAEPVYTTAATPTLVAANVPNLWSGAIGSAISFDAGGTYQTGSVWTGTKYDGTTLDPLGSSSVRFGSCTQTNAFWVDGSAVHPPTNTYRLYAISSPLVKP